MHLKDIEPRTHMNPVLDVTSAPFEKKSKKDKKVKKKSKSVPVDPESVLPTEPAQIVSDNGDYEKSTKKKTKKRKHADLELEAAAEKDVQMDVDADPGTIFVVFCISNSMFRHSFTAPEVSEKRKKKKKKHSDEGQDIAADIVPTEGKKEKKKKEKKDKVVESEFTDQKNVKLEKKDKKRKDKKPAENVVSQSGPSNESSTASSSTPAEISAFLTQHNITIHVPSSSSPVTPFIHFSQLPIPDPLRTFSAKFKEPSPVQACTWPPALEGKDVVGIAETGSGKTLAFGVPALARLISSPPPPPSKSSPTITTLVLAPTRELALQTHEALEGLGEQFGIASVAVFGGVPKEGQVKMLKNLHKANSKLVTRIIVGTPGRILDLMSEGACDLSG